MSTITTTRPTPTFDPHPIPSPSSPSSPSGQSLVASPFFEDLLDPNLTPIRICQLHGITLADLRRITESQEYKQALEDIAAINENRREAINDQLRTEALASAAELIKDATRQAEDNRTNIAHPRQSGIHINPSTQHQALAAATRQHAANARLLETRRKAINTILKECKAESDTKPKAGGAMQVTKSPACSSTYETVPYSDPQGQSRPARHREQPNPAALRACAASTGTPPQSSPLRPLPSTDSPVPTFARKG